MPDKLIYKTWSPDGEISAQIEIGSSVKRKHFERLLPAAVEVGLDGWQKAHLIGAGFGKELEAGIRYAPSEFNLQYQNADIEEHVRFLYKNKLENVTIAVNVTGKTHPRTLRLKEVTYRITLTQGGVTRDYFSTTLNIADKKIKPKVWVSDTVLGSAYHDIESYLKGKPGRVFGQLSKRLFAKAPKAPKVPKAPKAPKVPKTPKVPLPKAPLPKATATYRGTEVAARATSPASTGVSASSRGVTKTPALPKGILTKLDSFFKHVGQHAIKALPSIFKMISIAGIGMSIISLAEAYLLIKNIFEKGTAIPQVDDELRDFISAINNANTQVDEIYESNILELDIMTLADELFDIGDKESLDKIGDVLSDDEKFLSDFKKELESSHYSLVEVQKNLKQISDSYYSAYTNLLALESASKGTALLLYDAYKNKANSLSSLITSTKTSIDTLESLINNFDEMFDYVNEFSTVIQVLRNRDVAGLEIYPTGVKPLKSEWGPETTPE